MRDLILVLGGETPSGRAIARKLRAEHYFCKLLCSDASLACVTAQSPAGIIFAGELGEGASAPKVEMLSAGVPVLALGSSARWLLSQIGARQEGEAIVGSVTSLAYRESPLFENVAAGERWIERAEPFSMPDSYRAIADTDRFPMAFADADGKIYLAQFQIERNDPDGMAMLLSFADTICGCTAWWTVENIVAGAEKELQSAVGDSQAICALSGGVDSTVAAMLAKRVLGDRVHCVFVDTGLMRAGEADETERYFREELALSFARVDASKQILGVLRGLTDKQEKWRVIEEEITKTLLEEAAQISGDKVFVRGTNYVDVLGNAAQTEPPRLGPVVEPLRELFKEEVRDVGEYLNLGKTVLYRQPFPGMGLAARIEGEVTEDRVKTLRVADAIFHEALVESGQDKKLSRHFAILDQVDGRDAIILRATQGSEPTMVAARLPNDLLERTVGALLKELPTIDRVLYDMTPGMAERISS